MLHPIDYRLSKNKFWLSTWNSYSLKNYKNLILNDKILNILGFIFKNCFKLSYSFASPWSNPRKYRKYFSNFIIGFDGRRAIKTGPNKVKKLPGFLIPEDYNIIRFHNFSILKIYFLIDKNLETYWAKKQKKWRSPLKYFNMRYNKNKNLIGNQLKLNKNLVNMNIEKKNFKITGFFVYLLNLLNNNSVKQKFYFNLSDQIDFLKMDKKHLYFRFYHDNFKLLNKIRNNYFLFYLINKQNLTLNSSNAGLFNKKKIKHKNHLNIIYLNLNKKMLSVKKNSLFRDHGFSINYQDYKKYITIHKINSKKNKNCILSNYNNFNFYKQLLRNNNFLNISSKKISDFTFYGKKKIINNFKKYFFFTRLSVLRGLNSSNNFSKFLNKKLQSISLNLFKNNFVTSKNLNFDLNMNRKRGLSLFFYSSSSVSTQKIKEKSINNIYLFKKNKTLGITNNYLQNNLYYDNSKQNNTKFKKNWDLYLLNNRFSSIGSNLDSFTKQANSNLVYKKQNYYNYKYYISLIRHPNNLNSSIHLENFKKIIYFNKNFLLDSNSNKYTKKILDYKPYFLKNYEFQNWSTFSYLLNSKLISKKSVGKSSFLKARSKKLKLNNYFNKLFIYNPLKINFSFNKLLLKKNIYSYLTNYKPNTTNDSLKSNKKFKIFFNNNKSNLQIRAKNNLGNVLISITNYNKKKNYLNNLVEYGYSDYFNSSKTSLIKRVNEYKTFLKIKNFNSQGLNLYSINNFNYENFISNDYFSLLNNKKKLVNTTNKYLVNPTGSSKVSMFKTSINFKKWDYSKNIRLQSLFNTYFKKTFFKFFGNQKVFSQDNLDQINYRLEKSPKNNIGNLLKFKPYTFKSISRLHRYKYNQSILTKYITNEIKYNSILNFFNSMENKKFISKKNLGHKSFKVWFNTLLKAKGGILLNNISFSKFNKLKLFNYSFFPFMKKLQWLMFLNKNIKTKDKYISKESKKKTKKYLVNYKNLIIQKNSYSNYMKRLQFKYFKRAKRSFNMINNNNIKTLPYKFLLFDNSVYTENKSRISKNNFNTNFLMNFENISSKKGTFNTIVGSNNYKYKINIYNYTLLNKKIKLKQFYLPIKFNKKLGSIIPLVLKTSLMDSNMGYKKSNNMVINKYIKNRLSNIFLSIKSIHQISKNKKIQLENFNYRVYGLAKKISDVKFLNKKEVKNINKLQPKTFLYWKHLKWFNVFIKTKFNFKINNGYNRYNTFKLYENFKNLNFYYYKNFKKHNNYAGLNSSQLLNNNYNKLNTLIFYSTILKFKSSFLYFSNKRSFHKKKLLLNWTYDVLFSSTHSKRLNYLPHIRFKPIKDSIYMWRINNRKLNLLSKYFRARTKFFQNKLNFVSNYSKRSGILSYLKLMESNFLRIKKSMQRELPLVHIRRYLLYQLKKLNNYMRILFKRQKKRLYFKLKQQKGLSSIISKSSNIYKSSSNTINLSKENKYIFKKLYNFVNTRYFLGKKNLIDYVKKFIEHLFLVIFKFNHLRIFYIKKYQINIMSTKAKLFKNLFNYRLATGFKVPFLVKVICKKLNFDKSLVGCKIGFFGRYSKKLRNRKLWKYVKHLKPSVISTPLDYYNILILQKWGITGIKLSMLRKKTFNFIFN